MNWLGRGCILWFTGFLMANGQGSGLGNTVLRVAAWTSSGERIEKIWVVVTSLDKKNKYTGNGRDVKLSVPVGQYVLRVEAPGFQSMRQMVTAYQPTVFRSFALAVAYLHGQMESTLSGKVVGYKGDLSTIRVRLMAALYGCEVVEAVPDRGGIISFPVDSGVYALITIVDQVHGPKVADWREIRINGAETVTSDLTGFLD